MTGETLKSLLFFLMMMFFSYVHECAHMAAAGYFGRRGDMKNRGIFGNVMYLDPDVSSPVKMMIYMAGPGANLIIVLVALVIRESVKYSEIMGFSEAAQGTVCGFLEMVMMANILLAAFNLLPFFPLDGGRAAVLIIGAFTGHSAAIKIGILFSGIFAVCVFISGLYLVKYNLMNIILSADAIYFLYILRGEIYGPY